LRRTAAVLENEVRQINSLARFGGEEFSLLLPGTSKMAARDVAERLRLALEAYTFEGQERQPSGNLTVSLGVATYPGDATSAEELLRAADRALYLAKSKGKNLVELYGGNRRSFRRLEASVSGSFRSIAGEHSFRTVDLSTGGIKFYADCELPVGSLFDVRLQLPGGAPEIAMAVRAVSVTPTSHDAFEFAAQTLDIERQALGALVSYLREIETEESEESTVES
jgi:hypothetical protein